MTLLVLYEDLAAYFIKCISVFAQLHQVKVHIICREVNKEAPFRLQLGSIKTYSVREYTNKELIKLAATINPDAIFCGGWANKTYLKIAKKYKGEISTIVGFDNKWDGALKQQLARLIAPFYITNKFDMCFVPANQQKTFALKIGFKETQIALGAYCCDFDLFHNQYLANKKAKQNQLPKRFIYVGRYIKHKGIKDLWQAFIELQNERPNDWELWCLGTGDIKPVEHQKIKHFGFVQPDDLPQYIKETGVFILPSHFEPWGVVVHEFAAAGFPLVCSDEVGANTTFVEHNINGYIYKASNILELKNQLKKVMQLDNSELFQMAEKSVEKAKQITPKIWAETLMKLINPS